MTSVCKKWRGGSGLASVTKQILLICTVSMCDHSQVIHSLLLQLQVAKDWPNMLINRLVKLQVPFSLHSTSSLMQVKIFALQ